MSDQQNPYKVAAQLRKVVAMTYAIDKAAKAKGANVAQVLEALEKYSDANRAVVDKVAQLKNPSSNEVREMVKKGYRERIKDV